MSAEQSLQLAMAMRDKVALGLPRIHPDADLRIAVMKVLAIAATGMSAQQLNRRGHREQHREHQHDFVQARPAGIHRSALPDRSGSQGRARTAAATVSIPEGASLGLGVRAAAIRNLHIQGAMTQTGNRLDLAIDGRGWFKITAPEGETL